MTSFADQLKALTEKAKGNIDTAVRQTVILATQSLVLKSPVDTGRFRGNWVLGVGAINTTAAAAPDKGGAQSITRIAELMQAQGAGKVHYITNSLPYAKPLEYGHSDQAPGGMVRLTCMELPGMIRTLVDGLK